ncbi:MAG: ABC transporter ATP-binding protein/permease [Firmicutes bacterium]|nr:ABC transporter ATP-binding protein/permease [Bacillota bacterium]
MTKKLLQFFTFVKSKLNHKTRLSLIVISLISLILSVISFALPLLQKNLIDNILTLNNVYILYYFILAVLFVALTVIISIISNSYFMNTKRILEDELLSSISKKDSSILKSRGSGAFMVSMFGDTEQLATIMSINYFNTIFISLAAIATLIISLKWTMTFGVIVIVSYIVIFAIIHITNKKYEKNFNHAREVVYEVNPKVLEYIENRRSIMGYSSVQEHETNIRKRLYNRDGFFKKAFAYSAIGKNSITAIKSFAITIFFLVAVIEINNGSLLISEFLALLMYFQIVFIPLSSIQELLENIKAFNVFKNRIDESLDIHPKHCLPINHTFEVSNCTISHTKKDLIKNFSLSLNKKYGLVGLSGEGKSSIIKLFLGENVPETGFVKLGTIDLTNIPRPLVFSSIRYYGQEQEIFDANLDFNITLGKKPVSHSVYEDLIESLSIELLIIFNKIANKLYSNINNTELTILGKIYNVEPSEFIKYNLYEKISNFFIEVDTKALAFHMSKLIISREYFLIEKYNNLVSDFKLVELNNRNLGQRGDKISGGEKNRIALCRFLLPESEFPFILDEPLTSVDAYLEKTCLESMKKYLHSSNGIIISHKLNITKYMSDELLVLNEGILMEQGSHDDLIKTEGFYSKLYQAYKESN